jgi:hypothetical protein
MMHEPRTVAKLRITARTRQTKVRRVGRLLSVRAVVWHWQFRSSAFHRSRA